jgi:ABC-type polysaccharide/polyol phosphate transport system ATPase subunit
MDPYLNLQKVVFCRKISTRNLISKTHVKKKKVRDNEILSEIDLCLNKGDRVGLLGENGAGKTTLLRIMAKILTPKSGSVETHGKISTFIDSGYGMDVFLTGRANALSRAIMSGFSKRKSLELVDWIEDFSGLGSYFDQPVKTYSSGMVGRLVFAIDVSMPLDILLIDEGIGAADKFFQDKAEVFLEKTMEEANILVLASHSNQLLRKYCDRGIVLRNGRIGFDGKIDDAISFYES